MESVSGTEVRLRGVDLLDGTPILDIKPYIPDYDAPAALRGGADDADVRTPAWINNAEDDLVVLFGERALKDLEGFPEEERPQLRQTISAILSADPR